MPGSRVSRAFFIEPKPCEPTKHQYDYDSATVIGFLRQYDLLKDFKLNIEVNHATLAGHTFTHELQVAVDAGVLGSMDANRGDYQNGWDTDQFPNNINELVEAMLIILEGGGFGAAGSISTPSGGVIPRMRRICSMRISAGSIRLPGRWWWRMPSCRNPIIRKVRAERYASFDSGKGAAFEKGGLSLEDLRELCDR
jgi:xylose isomerase